MCVDTGDCDSVARRGPGNLKLSEDDNTILEARQDGRDLLVCWRDDGSSGSWKNRPSLYLTESCLVEMDVHKQGVNC